MQVNTSSYVEVSVEARNLSIDPTTSDGGAVLRITPEEAKELARRLTDAVKDIKRSR